MKSKQLILNTGRKINTISNKLDNENENTSDAAKKCTPKKRAIKFGCSGLHDGPRTDYTYILSKLWQTFVKPPLS